MTGLIVKRLLSAIPLLIILSLFCFAILRAIPGDPIDVLLGNSQKDVSAADLAELKKEFGIDEPWTKQYMSWVTGFVGKGELGRSYRDGRPVLEVIVEKIPATIALTATALVMAFAGGILLGLSMSYLSMRRTLKPLSDALTIFTLLIYSTPSFWLALLALFVFTQKINWAPVLAFSTPGLALNWTQLLSHVWLPASVLAVRRAAKVALFVKTSIVDELSKQYVVAARSRGLSVGAVLVRHVFKNSLNPVISLLGLSLPALLGGSVLVETIFAWPGLGRLVVDATFGRNYPVLTALTVIYGLMVVLSNLTADILSRLNDPRMADGRGEAAHANF